MRISDWSSDVCSSDLALAYSKHVYDIVSGVQGDLSKLTEEQIAQGQQHVSDAIDQIAKNAPTGSEGAVAILKSSLATANSRSEEHTSELQSLMRISYAVFCLKKNNN